LSPKCSAKHYVCLDVYFVDGRHLLDRFLAGTEDDSDAMTSPDKLLHNCKTLGVNCSSFMLYKADMDPGNMLMGLSNATISIVDFECFSPFQEG
jgi:hypothetical protein